MQAAGHVWRWDHDRVGIGINAFDIMASHLGAHGAFKITVFFPYLVMPLFGITGLVGFFQHDPSSLLEAKYSRLRRRWFYPWRGAVASGALRLA